MLEGVVDFFDLFTNWNESETMRYETMLHINKSYFLFTVYMLFYLTFFSYADVYIFAKTNELFSYIFMMIQDKSIVFTVSMKFAINRT